MSSLRTKRRSVDVFGLHSELFQFLASEELHGEAFAGYRALGHPMVLCAADGTALASLHLRPTESGVGLITRMPEANKFQGVINEDGQHFELIMTNLTTDSILLMDIGGDARHQEPEFWELTTKTFWSGAHRNDGRLNRSNILWPMKPNTCSTSFLHFQQTGDSRRLRLLAHATGAEGAGELSATGNINSYPIHVYPKYGSRLCPRFEQTYWCCPETVVVVGTPGLVESSLGDYNILVENPLARATTGGWEAVVNLFAEHLGVSSERLLEATEIDREFLAHIPDEMVHELLMTTLTQDKRRKLLEDAEPTANAPLAGARQSSPSASAFTGSSLATSSRAASPGRSSSASFGLTATNSDLDRQVASARPADITAGSRVPKPGVSSLMIEKFDFARKGAPAVLCFGVQEQLRICSEVKGNVVADLRKQVAAKFKTLQTGRRDVMMENITSVFETSECVVCLQAGTQPDCVLYQCGHRCVHLRCIQRTMTRCPLCRTAIVAVLPL